MIVHSTKLHFLGQKVSIARNKCKRNMTWRCQQIISRAAGKTSGLQINESNGKAYSLSFYYVKIQSL